MYFSKTPKAPLAFHPKIKKTLSSLVSCISPSSASVSSVICNERLVVCCLSPPSLCAGLLCFVLFGGLLRCLSVQAVAVPRDEAPRLTSPRRTVPSLVVPGLSSPRCVSAPSSCTRTVCKQGFVQKFCS
ncbi:uncharacterized protein DS421_11g323790 [Arachis hypogaea]|nr:uncharacterized protein DS421_11g323790 [Arachis hypogaea]